MGDLSMEVVFMESPEMNIKVDLEQISRSGDPIDEVTLHRKWKGVWPTPFANNKMMV